jgi:hypothetical protein
MFELRRYESSPKTTVSTFPFSLGTRDMPDPINAVGTAAGKELLKPIGSVADALAAPWVTRLRRWATDRDLQRRLDDPRLAGAFTSYARRLQERVTAIRTVLSREPLPFSVVYEPLSLVLPHSKAALPDAELRQGGARTIVVDGAGMGKSTYARRLITDALEAEDLVPAFLELRRIEPGTSLKEAIAREFDDFDQPFERDLLFRLFKVGRFFFVLDGLDEVPTDQRRTLLSELEELSVSAEQSALVLTTRPETALPSFPNGRSLTIKPLTREQSESLVRRYDRALGGLDLGERLIEEFAAVPPRFLQTPLLVALLYRTFGYTHSISTRVSIFYDELYNALYKGHDLTKSGFVRAKVSGLDVAEFRRLVRGFAFLVILNQRASLRGDGEAQEIAADASRLTSVVPISAAGFVEDLLAAVPLLVRDGLELRFIHKSIAEFFAAEYLAIGNPEGDQMISDILTGPLTRRFAPVFDFLADLDPPLFRRAVVAPLAEIAARHEPDEPEPILRTLSYLGDVYLLFYPSTERKRIPVSPCNENDGIMTMTGMVGSKLYAMDASICKFNTPLSFLVWKEMSEGYTGTSRSQTFDSFIQEFPVQVWVSISDPPVRNALQHKEFRAILADLIAWIQSPDTPQESARLLDEGRLRALMGSASADRGARKWVRDLLGREVPER